MSFTVLTAEFAHESNTFSRCPADYAAFQDRGFALGEAAIAARGEANTSIAGFLDIGRPAGWQVIHAISASAQPSGPVTRDAYDRIAGVIVEAAKAHAGSIDGVLLGLHGAMVTEFCEDGEGELLERLRAVLGKDVPIGITLDPHANVTRKMTDLADIVVSYKTYPHVDVRETGRLAADIMQRTLAGEIRPVTLRVERPMLEEVNGGRTDIGPMVERIAKAKAYEQEPDVFAVSVNGGFGNADITEVGPTVLVTCQGDLERHRAFADALAEDMWQRRFEVITPFLSVEDAVAEAASYVRSSGPLIIADYADNPGGGGYGDATELLRGMIAADLEDACFGPIVDPEAAAELRRGKPGTTVSVRLGGKVDPTIGGGPLSLTGTLVSVSDGDYVGDGPMLGGLHASWGPCAVLRVGGIDILVTTLRAQMNDLQQFRAFGIDPAAKRVVGLKSMQHFRAAFEPIAGKVIVCDSGALCTPDLSKLPYQRARRPIFPLDR
ncbi:MULTISPECIES: M81 family metallopeptidase [unclassified Bosea (in: a-proteobacteria)]|uniref:M81 family metallopeptidase n=1 Tax=unclassified Bosea (in: a-proteobacteria) TaxID=2653178 RepID=UPI000F75C04F|nr:MULTISPECIES: M81 family metallopeptidase [unclassified Bosea (in: a-proteobacteria)]AZO77046.1 microcystin degradation protein MlrC [Bosea sp. Tri-49]RXT21891.1 microcystin degradation protein MlrC [Bosea sp. Tri-39]RXT32230.1 microcystin degradation protein MlrC [Bosea sp. Tri-54]